MPRGGWAPPGRVTSACDVAGTGLVHLPAERSPGAPTPPARFTASRMIAGIVLAAGFARRMGRQKLLLQLEGKPVVRWVVEGLLPRVEDVVVVTGHDDSAVRDALAGLAARFAVNPRPQEGQGSSIAVGVAALKPWTRAALIALGDQPKTPDPVVPALLAAFARGGKPIVVPVFKGTQGTPVVFAREVFPELHRLTGDAGARSVVNARPERVERVVFDLPMPPDVDTPEDYARLHVQ
ncbi:MAG: nucleotidyltransferase family protein [Candidatus Rokuibacteriota bacterium]|nr:MAG: nucleotidyltransferase family protein [Candidatus Rokubacteria bacterium]